MSKSEIKHDIVNLVEKEAKDEPVIPKKSGNRLLVSSTTQPKNQSITSKQGSAILSLLASEEN